MEIIYGTAQAKGTPLIHIHFMERTVEGNGIAIKVYGEMKVISDQKIYAKDLKLNTIETLDLTPMGSDQRYSAQKYIVNKGEYDNYASVHVFNANDNRIDASSYKGPETDGSIWVDFIASGE